MRIAEDKTDRRPVILPRENRHQAADMVFFNTFLMSVSPGGSHPLPYKEMMHHSIIAARSLKRIWILPVPYRSARTVHRSLQY